MTMVTLASDPTQGGLSEVNKKTATHSIYRMMVRRLEERPYLISHFAFLQPMLGVSTNEELLDRLRELMEP